MKIRWHGMLGTNHSWAFTQQALARAMAKAGGHDVFLKSTNGLKHFPEDLEPLLVPGYHCHLGQPFAPHYMDEARKISVVARPAEGGPPELPDPNVPYDLEIAYTIFMQAVRRFRPDSASKMVIWNFESSIMPPGWQMYHRAVDYFLPSSQYSSDIFVANGVPREKSVVVPHGVYPEMFNPDIPPFQLRTQKKVKFLHCAIPHHRKLHERVLRAYFDAFTADDDVCLVLKTKLKTPDADKPFEVDVRQILNKAAKGRTNLPEVEVVQSFVPDIGSLYTACDAVVSMSSCEGFWLPGLEALACGALVIAPRHGGQLDFLEDANSLLVDTGEMKAPPTMQYWHSDRDAVVGDPDVRHCAELMRRVYADPDAERRRTADARRRTIEKFTWERAAKMITDLAEESLARKRSAPRAARRKVLYIAPYSWAGGGEVWIREALRRLDREAYEPRIVCPSGADEGLRALFADLDVPLDDLREQEKNRTLGLGLDPEARQDLRGHAQGASLKALIEAERPDIVHFHNSLMVYQVLLRCLKDGAWRGRIVETVHSELNWRDSMAKVGKRQGVSLIAAVSRTLGEKVAKRGNRHVAVLPQQVDWDRFRRERSRAVLDEMRLSHEGRLVVGMVARLSPEKNIPMALECARLMPDALFVVVGDGPQEPALRAAAGRLGNVALAGWRGDTERFYPAFDVLLLTSKMEGLPLVALEAMAAGAPVVASSVGALPEIVTDGLNGFLVPQQSPRAFVDALSRFADPSIREAFSDNARGVAAQQEEAGRKADINKLYALLFKQEG